MSSHGAAALEAAVDEAMILEAVPATSGSDGDDFAAFRAQVRWWLSGVVVEDGVPHPAEAYFASTLRAHPTRAPGWMEALYAEYAERNAVLAAGLVRCVGRCGQAIVQEWGLAIVRAALHHGDARVRDAAVATIDFWEDSALFPMLDPDREPLSWLAQYMRAIQQDVAVAGIPFLPKSEVRTAEERTQCVVPRRSGVSVLPSRMQWVQDHPVLMAILAAGVGCVVLLMH
ncbi:hypothetical protein HY632_04175 [Candidatus Uhrbacteria bacterium]|nr:hypothetical protein [Candidatus Uhrbacteria bacterium]